MSNNKDINYRKNNFNGFNSKIILGKVIETKHFSFIPVISMISIYSSTKAFKAVGGSIILDPLAIILKTDCKTHIYSIKSGKLLEDLSELTKEAFDY